MKKIWKPILAAAFWICLWQAVSMIVNKPYILASPIQTAVKLWGLCGTELFWQSVLTSVTHILLGFFVAVVMGVLAATAASRFEWVRVLLSPLVLVVKSVPVASFIIIVLIWFGSRGLAGLISALMVFPVIYTDTLTGIGSVPKPMKETMRIFRMKPRYRMRYVYLPAAFPYFTSGCRVALGLCWKAGVAAELIGLTEQSIGEQLYYSKLYFDTAELFSYTFVIVLISFVFEKTVMKLFKTAGEVLTR